MISILNTHLSLQCFCPQISTVRRQGRTLFSTVPETAEKEAHSLFVQEVELTHLDRSLLCPLLFLSLGVMTEALIFSFCQEHRHVFSSVLTVQLAGPPPKTHQILDSNTAKNSDLCCAERINQQ